MQISRAIATVAILLWASPAGADEPEQKRSEGDDIIVTGQRGEAASTKSDVPLIEVPQAISVVDAETLRERNVVRLADALTTVAGVSRSSTYGF